MASGDTLGHCLARHITRVQSNCRWLFGGSAAAVSAILCLDWTRGARVNPQASAWNSVAGMRTPAGLVSRGGVYSGWPSLAGSLGPITRTIADTAAVLDVIVSYDPEDPPAFSVKLPGF
jgi:Asp-tRNA(Asn)/Glu-tRNA(Gln) amidotransferase A subunit family amidase